MENVVSWGLWRHWMPEEAREEAEEMEWELELEIGTLVRDAIEMEISA